MTGDETMEDSGIIKTQYTDREIWDFGVRRGFPENLELSLFRRGAWDFFSEGLTDGTEQEVPEAAATTEIEEAQAEENPESAESNIKIEESNAETEIQEAISKLVKNKTVLIIAHRMRTVTNADKIVLLKDGVVKEQGNPKELLEKDSIFKDMVQKQQESLEWNLN